MHTSGGYLVYAAMTHEYTFDYHDGDVFWCTADVGWVTGHSYIVYGPLANGATTLMFEGVPTYPDAGRFWAVCEQAQGQPVLHRADRDPGADGPGPRVGREARPVSACASSARWASRSTPRPGTGTTTSSARANCPIVDTWWQTETGGHLLTPLPGAIPTKPGSATLPFFGVQPVVLDAESGRLIEDEPGRGRALPRRQLAGPDAHRLGRPRALRRRPISAQYKGYYFSGDGCRRDADGYYWITGRVDDVINVSGHRMGTAEVESALVAHAKVAEAAVVGYPHDIKGQGIYAYVTLMNGVEPTDALRKELRTGSAPRSARSPSPT